MRVLSLPSFDAKFDYELPEEIILMLLGGRQVSSDWLSALGFYKRAWAVDSGVDLCMASNIIPERLIGDGDSAAADAWRWAADKGAKVYAYEREKDLTDFQLALELLTNESFRVRKGVFLTGAFGGRFDHLISVFNSFSMWSRKYLPIGLADEKEAVLLLSGKSGVEMTFRSDPTALSLIPFEDSRGVSISGVTWPLKKTVLERARPYSISNRPAGGGSVAVSVEDGLIGVYCMWDGFEK